MFIVRAIDRLQKTCRVCTSEIWTRELLSVNLRMSSVPLELSGGKNQIPSVRTAVFHLSNVHFQCAVFGLLGDHLVTLF